MPLKPVCGQRPIQLPLMNSWRSGEAGDITITSSSTVDHVRPVPMAIGL